MRPLGHSYEILIVDTQTALDNTEIVCREQNCRWVRRQGGKSFGCAVRTGISEARGERIIFMDADGSHTPEFLPQMISASRSCDIVIASRYVEGGYTENTRLLVAMSMILNWSYSVILNLHCKDVSNSFKVYRASLLKPLHLHCENFDIIEEILFKIVRDNRDTRILEIPFSFKKRMFGKTKRNLLVFIITFVWTMVKLRFSSRR